MKAVGDRAKWMTIAMGTKGSANARTCVRASTRASRLFETIPTVGIVADLRARGRRAP
jgi:hypothetical protein